MNEHHHILSIGTVSDGEWLCRASLRSDAETVLAAAKRRSL
jgi:hypothetical protein